VINNDNNNNNNKTETTQHTTGANRALTQVDYTHRLNEIAKIVNKESAVQCGLSNAKPTRYQNVSHNLCQKTHRL
jgi:hypothetical protein